MSNSQWQVLEQALKKAALGASASEVHGVVSGLICGGIDLEDRSWYPAFNDLMNDGQALPAELKPLVDTLFLDSSNAISGDNLDFNLLIADEPIQLRAATLVQWVESFLAGFAVMQNALKKIPKEIKEAIDDLSQIAQLDSDVEDNEDTAQGIEELYEYVRTVAMLCFEELGRRPQTADKNSTVH